MEVVVSDGDLEKYAVYRKTDAADPFVNIAEVLKPDVMHLDSDVV